MNQFLRSKERKLKSENGLIQLTKKSVSKFINFIRTEIQPTMPIGILLIGSIILLGIFMSIFGIVNILYLFGMVIGSLCYIIFIAITFVPGIQNLVLSSKQSLYVKKLFIESVTDTTELKSITRAESEPIKVIKPMVIKDDEETEDEIERNIVDNTKFVKFSPELYRDINIEYNPTTSISESASTIKFSDTDFIGSPNSILALNPIISSDLYTKKGNTRRLEKNMYIIYRNQLIKCGNENQHKHPYEDLRNIEILIDEQLMLFKIIGKNNTWIMQASNRKLYDKWLNAFAFCLTESVQHELSEEISELPQVRRKDIKNPSYQGPLAFGEDQWHAVLRGKSLFFFTTLKSREPSADELSLEHISVEPMSNEIGEYLIRMHNNLTGSIKICKAPTETSRNEWLTFLHAAGNEERDDDFDDFNFDTISLCDDNSEQEDFPSLIRIPKEDVEGVGLSVASYELLNPTKVGFLYKRGDVNKRWQRRYFVLKGTSMYYFRDITVSIVVIIIYL